MTNEPRGLEALLTRPVVTKRRTDSPPGFVIEGLPTTIPLHQRLMAEPAFLNGDYHIRWLERDFLGS